MKTLEEFQVAKEQITESFTKAFLAAEEKSPGALQALFRAWAEQPLDIDIEASLRTVQRLEEVLHRLPMYTTDEDPTDELERAVLVLERIADDREQSRGPISVE